MSLPFARKTFAVSRLADFASVSEIAKLVGHAENEWPLIIVKELADNALDEAEEAGVAPAVEVSVSEAEIVVADLVGRGIAPETVASIADYAMRTSSREAYVSPTRGQQGNAMQAVLAMGFALDGERGETVIESQGIAHRIVFAVDSVRRTPTVRREQGPSSVQIGMRTTVKWPVRACSNIAASEAGFVPTLASLAWLNPHLTLVGATATRRFEAQALDPGWKKWRPSEPTSPHWYDAARLSRLIAAEIAYAEDHGERPMTVRDFLEQFRGLKRTRARAAICEAVGASGMSLCDFFDGGPFRIEALLKEMQAQSAPVNPKALGVIGRDHVMVRFADYGCDEDTFAYQCAAFEDGGLPYVMEAAFAYSPEREGPGFVSGLNFSPLIGETVPFRNLSGLLAAQYVGDEAPVLIFLHLACPRLDFLDKGKTTVALPNGVGDRFKAMVEAVTKRWAKQREAEIRDANAEMRRRETLARARRALQWTKKEAAYSVMEAAYKEASSGNALPANARQVYYPGRRMMLPLLGEGRDISDEYFIQTLLPDFMANNPDLTKDWDVVFDDRGSAVEPHTERVIDLGTLNVRDYLKHIRDPKVEPAALADAFVDTFGPKGRYGAVLYIEKEGFDHLIKAARIRERFDVMPMSSKGYSNIAARKLVDIVCGELGLPLFVLHDFDRDGFGIKQTLVESGRRYDFENKIKFVDLGLRLPDVRRLTLDSEVVTLKRMTPEAAREQLQRRGATKAEIAFLIDGRGVRDLRRGEESKPHRVELNSLSSGQLVALIEEGFAGRGVTKVVPPAATMAEAFAAFAREKIARPVVERYFARLERVPIETPADLEARVRAYLAEHPAETWDIAVRKIAEGEVIP